MFLGLLFGAACAVGLARLWGRSRWLRRHAWAGGPGYGWGPPFHRYAYDDFDTFEIGPHDWDPYEYAARRSPRGFGRAARAGCGWSGLHGGRTGWRGRAALGQLIDSLDPTPEQRRTILGAIDDVRARAQSLAADLAAGRRELAAAVRAEPFDESAFARASEQAQAAARSLGEPLGRALFEIHQALDPRQRRILADWIERAHH